MKDKRVIGERLSQSLLGALDYYRFPDRRMPWGGPFNGQTCRKALFVSLVQRLTPVAIIETGTHLGATTEFLATLGCPIYTVEAHPRTYGFARVRLRKHRNITLFNDESRRVLRRLLTDPSYENQNLLFYLDAHWYSDLPLAEELDIIFERCSAAVVMIDDFQVPDDEGYGFDDYGPGQALTSDYIEAAVAAHKLSPYYPTTPSAEESGARRGCIVLAKNATHRSLLASIPLLRPAHPLLIANPI